MAANGTTRGGGLFNVALQVLKFVLLALAIYSMSLSQQLGIKLPATLALVDATPAIQGSRDGSFKVAFYALHFLEDYKQLGVKVFIKRGLDHTQELANLTLERRDVPFYSETIKLPSNSPEDKYLIAYEVAFDKKIDKIKSTGKSYQIEYSPIPLVIPAACVPIFVRKGQRAPLPAEWEGMEFIPSAITRGITVETVGGKKWLRAGNINSRPLPYGIEFESLMIVDAKKDLCLFTRNGRTQQAGPTVCIDNDTSFFGAINKWGDIVPGDHIAFLGSANQDKNIKASQVIASRGDGRPHAGVTSSLMVLENMPPRSAYAQDGPDEVSLFTSWIFWDTARSMRFLNLNRYIIDPDGRDEKDQPDIRVRQLRLAREDPRFELQRFELQPPSGSGIEFRLYFRQELEQVFRGINSLEIPLIAQDEANPEVHLILKIAKDYISR